jgi:hypothetical protein
MWIVLVGDMDIDYASAYGPFNTVGEANAVADLYPDDASGEDNVRVVRLGTAEDLRSHMEAVGRA